MFKDEESIKIQVPALLLSTQIAVGCCLGCFIFFMALRTKRPKLYMPRITNPISGIVVGDSVASNDNASKGTDGDGIGYSLSVGVPVPKNSLFGWLFPVVQSSSWDVLQWRGGDAFMFLETFKALAIICAAVLVFHVVFVTAGEHAFVHKEQTFENWVDILAVYFTLLVTTGVLYLMLDKYERVRRHYFSTKPIRNITLFVEDLPNHLRDHHALVKYLENDLGCQVDSLRINRDLHELDALVEKRALVVKKLEKAMGRLMLSKTTKNPEGVRPQTRKGFLGLFGDTEDTIDTLTEQLNELNTKITTLQKKEWTDWPVLSAGNAFICFATVADFEKAKQNLPFKCRKAPDPKDVHWSNMPAKSIIRPLTGAFVTILIVFFWAMPIGFIALWTDPETWRTNLPFLEPALEYEVAVSVLSGFMPSTMTIMLMWIAPIALRWAAEIEGVKAYSWIDRDLLVRFTIIEIINVLLVSTIAGGFITLLSQIIKDPVGANVLVANALSSQSWFFLNYVTLECFLFYPAELSRIFDLFADWITLKFREKPITCRELEALAAPQPISMGYGVQHGRILLMFTVAVVYCCVSPAVLIFALAFFGMGFLVHKYNILYVYLPRYESGGTSWPIVVLFVYFGLGLQQMFMMTLLYMRSSSYDFRWLLPAPLISVGICAWLYITFKKVGNLHVFDPESEPLLSAAPIAEDGVRDTRHGRITAYAYPNLNVPGTIEIDPAYILPDYNKID